MPFSHVSAVRRGRPSPRPGHHRFRAWFAPCLVLLAGASAAGQGAGPPAPKPDAEPARAAGERLPKLTTSDGFALAAWFYPAAKPADQDPDAEVPPAAVVILLHDLGGSHKSLEPLALELQSRGIAVVAPDLRGHGATTGPEAKGDAEADGKSLKKSDFGGMAVTGGGRVRDQAVNRGDVETVRNWIVEHATSRNLDVDRLVVVGSGVGAAVAAQWTIADAAWPDLASGPQGRQVRGLVFVSPAWVTRGFSISPAVGTEPVRRTLPMLVIGGTNDSDAVKLYDQLKRQRPDGWSEKRVGQDLAMAPKLGPDSLPSLFLRQFETDLSGDRLAAFVPRERRGGHPADVISGFIGRVTAPQQ